MQYPAILAAAAIFMAGHISAQEATPQVNLYAPPILAHRSPLFPQAPRPLTTLRSYYDDACQDFAASEYPGNGVVTGGPAGSAAIIWVNGGPPDNPCCGCTFSLSPRDGRGRFDLLLTFSIRYSHRVRVQELSVQCV